MSVAEAIGVILTLNRTDRLRVAQEIIESVATEEDDPAITEDERRHLQEAIALADANPGAGRTWDEIEAELVALDER